MYLFTYGTLQKGHRLNDYLEKCKFISNGTIEANGLYEYITGVYPVLIEGRGSTIIGEIFEIDDQTLENLDSLESGYKRKLEKIKLYDYTIIEAFVYYSVMHDFMESKNFHLIDTGHWSMDYESKAIETYYMTH